MDVHFGIFILLGELIYCINCQRFDFLPKGQECPFSKEEWEKRSNARSCNSNTPYHCLKNQDGELGEVCVKRSMVEIGQCPIYHTSIKLIDFRHCKPFEGYTCATAPFISNTSFQHQACLRFPTSLSSTEKNPVTTRFTTPSTNGSSGSPTAVILLLLLILIVVGIGLVWWFYLRKNYNCRIPIPFTGGTITICHKDEEEAFYDLKEKTPLVLADQARGENQNRTPMEKKVKRSNPRFVETKNYRGIIRELEKNNVVLVVGNTGIGKSATSVGVLEYYRDIKEWKTIHFPLDQFEKVDERTIVLVDVAFGDLSLYSRYDSNNENMMNRLYTSTRECREYKVLITSSISSRNLQMNFPILRGCSELNMSYDISDLKNLYKEYTEPKCNFVNEREDKSKEKSNQLVNKDKSSDRAEGASTNEDYETTSALEKDNDKIENTINVGQKLSDTVISTKSDDGPQLSINPLQSEESAMRNDKNDLGDYNQTSTEDTCSGNEEDRKSSRDPEISCPPVQESGEDREPDPSKVKIEITDDHEEGNLEEDDNLKQEAEEAWKKSNVSKFGLPIVCYLPGGIEWNASSSEALDVISIFEIYVNNLAESDNGLDRQKYKTLVYIMLNGSKVDSKGLHKKLLSEIDQNLNQERFLLHAIVLAESGILRRKGNVFSFHNDLLLFVVINSFARQNIRTFLAYCYLPFSLQFLGPKSTGSRSPRRLKVEVDVHWRTLFEFWSRLFKQQRGSRDELQDFDLFQLFREKVEYHEKGTMEFYDIKDKNKTDRKGNVYVRKMVNHYPELEEYYSWAEPEKFKSIKVGFRSTPARHPPCSLE